MEYCDCDVYINNKVSVKSKKKFQKFRILKTIRICSNVGQKLINFYNHKMKMTLSSPNRTSDTTPDKNIDNKSLSSNSSPQTSPKPSPQPQTKVNHTKPDNIHLTVNYNQYQKEFNKNDGSPSSQDGLVNDRSTPLESIVSTESNIKFLESINTSEKKKAKKKLSWFNSFYSTYKTKSEDFKRVFKEVPDDERLVVDYACALQKDILLQGRLYVTQNFLCFYANIFGWETHVQIKWKDVLSIKKEKTVMIIPNAVLIQCTNNEKYFFTSFVGRDKTFLMLFRVWQNALLEQPMTPQELWQWIHHCYGNELGLTSEDEDYVAPPSGTIELSTRLSVESITEDCITASNILDSMIVEEKTKEDTTTTTTLLTTPDISQTPLTSLLTALPTSLVKNSDSESHISTDVSDTTESDVDKFKCNNNTLILDVNCSSSHHHGRQLINDILPINIDQLQTLLFSNSKFFINFHASRKTSDLCQTSWTLSPDDNSRNRIVNLTVALNQTMGPKTAQITESQTMLPCSKIGHLYSIDVDTLHSGIPYSDSFHIYVHYCLKKISENETSIAVFAQIEYKKQVWGLVKRMIEKNCWSGLEDFFNALLIALRNECDRMKPDNIKRKSRRKRKIHSIIPRQDNDLLIKNHSKLISVDTSTNIICELLRPDIATTIIFTALILLFIINVILYYKLSTIEDSTSYTLPDFHLMKNLPNSQDEWIKLLEKQEKLHAIKIKKWQNILKIALKLIKKSENVLLELNKTVNEFHINNEDLILLNSYKDESEKNEEL